ncbi:2420_t:CDS:2 [Dentiscutata erythropus]|uniref:2420_t:CDS:1 n=1 Tax=Dentiscutata erythropus TaxID=1348616 RepID=A0A9N8W9U6_9GLOM|nr:2420_t:CDS:2 [Dentiscutata erythropus]
MYGLPEESEGCKLKGKVLLTSTKGLKIKSFNFAFIGKTNVTCCPFITSTRPECNETQTVCRRECSFPSPPRIPPGIQEFKFEVDLPGHLPSSFKGTRGKIEYWCYVIIERPMFHADISIKKPVIIRRSLIPNDILASPITLQDRLTTFTEGILDEKVQYHINAPIMAYREGGLVSIQLSLKPLSSNIIVKSVEYGLKEVVHYHKSVQINFRLCPWVNSDLDSSLINVIHQLSFTIEIEISQLIIIEGENCTSGLIDNSNSTLNSYYDNSDDISEEEENLNYIDDYINRFRFSSVSRFSNFSSYADSEIRNSFIEPRTRLSIYPSPASPLSSPLSVSAPNNFDSPYSYNDYLRRSSFSDIPSQILYNSDTPSSQSSSQYSDVNFHQSSSTMSDFHRSSHRSSHHSSHHSDTNFLQSSNAMSDFHRSSHHSDVNFRQSSNAMSDFHRSSHHSDVNFRQSSNAMSDFQRSSHASRHSDENFRQSSTSNAISLNIQSLNNLINHRETLNNTTLKKTISHREQLSLEIPLIITTKSSYSYHSNRTSMRSNFRNSMINNMGRNSTNIDNERSPPYSMVDEPPAYMYAALVPPPPRYNQE